MGLPRQRAFPKPLQTIFLLFIGTFIVKTLVTLPCWDLDSVLGSLNHVDWSRFAYVQYATSTSHICNSLMIFESLSRLEAKADRVMIYPVEYSLDESDNSAASHLLRKARDQYNVKLVPAEIQSRASGDGMHPVSCLCFQGRAVANPDIPRSNLGQQLYQATGF